MTARRVETTPIDAVHVMTRVFSCADFLKPDGSDVRLDSDITCFLDDSTTNPKIFGFLAGDEIALDRQHGLVPERRRGGETQVGSKTRPRREPEGERQRLH